MTIDEALKIGKFGCDHHALDGFKKDCMCDAYASEIIATTYREVESKLRIAMNALKHLYNETRRDELLPKTKSEVEFVLFTSLGEKP